MNTSNNDREEQESLPDGERVEPAQPAPKETGQHLLSDLEARAAAREKVREKLRWRIGEMYW